jgi:hypothetical protein
MATLAAVMTEPVPPPRRAGALAPALSATLVHDPAARPTGEQLDRVLAAAEHGTAVPLGPPTPAGPAFPAPISAPQYDHRYQQPYPAFRPQEPVSRPAPTAMAAAYSVSAVVVIAAVVFLLNNIASSDDPSKGAGSPDTHVATLPNGLPTTPTTTTAAVPRQDLLTPAGARQAVSALAEVMGGTEVSDLDLFSDHASATAPAPAVENGFDNFSYRDGTATRDGPDTVDADRAVLDLNDVNWDALPALWERANKELGVDNPTDRFVVVDTDIIDGTPSMKLYLSDDYGAAYLLANLAGEVVELFPRG